MVDIAELFWGFSILSILFYLIRALREAIPTGFKTRLSLSPPFSCPWITGVILDQVRGLHSLQDDHLFPDAVVKKFVLPDSKIVVNVEQSKLRRRPSKLVVPEYSPDHMRFNDVNRKQENVEFVVQGRDYCLVSKKGRRQSIEDRYKVISDVFGDPNQAFFAVIDGHGGQAAADYVTDNLGKNILKTLEFMNTADQHSIEQAISAGYSQTDRDFLSQGVSSGACAASALIINGRLYTANVGDCRVVLSRKGLATRLTNDHCLSRDDERSRIENSGGFVHDYNGVWRVQGTLAVSRAIGDLHLKEWVISEPEIQLTHLASDCDFLIMASDGLWDKVSEQEAVDVVLREQSAMESCKKLVDVSTSRGNRDDITIIVINLQKSVTAAGTST